MPMTRTGAGTRVHTSHANAFGVTVLLSLSAPCKPPAKQWKASIEPSSFCGLACDAFTLGFASHGSGPRCRTSSHHKAQCISLHADELCTHVLHAAQMSSKTSRNRCYLAPIAGKDSSNVLLTHSQFQQADRADEIHSLP